MTLSLAIQRNITANELKNAWKYKYIYEVRKLPNFDRQNVLQQKYVGCFRGFLNFTKFIIGLDNETRVEEKVIKDKCCSNSHQDQR